MKNNGATNLTNVKVYRSVQSAGRLATGTSTGICSLTKGDTIEVWVLRTDGGAVSKTINCEHAVLNVMQIV